MVFQCVPYWLPSRPYDLIFTLCTCFYQCVPNWLFSTPYDLIFALCTQLTPFKTIWPNLTPFKTIWPNFINVLCAYFYQCVTNWLFSIPYDLIFALSTQMTPLKTIWPNFINVYPIDSFKHHMNGIWHCVPNWPNWLLSRPFDLIFALCTQFTPFKTIWPDFCIVYPIDSF